MTTTQRAEGFRGQVMHVLPRPLLAEAARHFLAGELYPTDLGWFPRARHHYRERPRGAGQHILLYCTAGRGWFKLDGRRAELKPRQALLIPQGQPHAYGADDAAPWSIHWVHFVGADAGWFGAALAASGHVLPVPQGVGRRAERLFRDCCGMFRRGATHKRILYAAQVLRHLLAVLFFDNPAFTPGMRSERVHAFGPLIEFMQRHLAEPLALEHLARRAALSPARFSALFKAQTGLPPIEYLIRLRVQEACRLLDTTPRAVKEVAAAVGYDDPYYFSRIFRRITGQSPRAYRLTMKG